MNTKTPPILQTGFRPFFLAAIVYSIIAMTMWTIQLTLHTNFALTSIDRTLWHGHEMLFGYTMAVIAGFLLTAVQNWTRGVTAQGKSLLMLVTLWSLSRLLALYPIDSTLPVQLISSALFYLMLLLVLIRPLLKAGNKAQWGIIGKLMLLLLLDALFLAAASDWLEPGYARPALLIAIYTVVGLILVMAQRVVVSFTRNAVEDTDRIKEYRWIPQVSLLGLLIFTIADVMAWQNVLLWSGIVIFAANALRLYGWHTVGIWRTPLVWVLHVAVFFISLGFLLRGSAHVFGVLPTLGLHAMTYGGIGLITTGMMARVALGHTGRNVFEPPAGVIVIFLLLVAGTVLRVLLPLVMMDYYFLLVQLSQFLWIGAFLIMLIYYFRPLVNARVDGSYG